MKIVGIICEYNPFHSGHKKQLDWIRAKFDGDCGIVCLMSGNFVQRGQPAIFDKSLRSQAAMICGADLVLELPVNYALSSAEGFAAGGVKILSKFCDYLCFGSESGDEAQLMETARILLSDAFTPTLKKELQSGVSFPSARQRALKSLGCDHSLLEKPNNILAVEYCKAILQQGCSMLPLPICRNGDYHATVADTENPSATAVRQLLLANGNWQACVPQEIQSLYTDATLHTVTAGERAILAKLRTMTDEEFASLPFGSEGLWRKLMHASRTYATLEEILTATKSKRYTRTRLDRMVMCAYLGITDLSTPPRYTRVLGFNDTGKRILKLARQSGEFLHIGNKDTGNDYRLEQRCDDLYSLFSQNSPEKPGMSSKRRVFLSSDTKNSR